MSEAVEQIKSFLKNPRIKKILIAEDHFDYAPKEALIDLFDEIAQGSFICQRKIILILEHISTMDQNQINDGVEKKQFNTSIETVFKKCPFVEPQNLEVNMYVTLAQKAIHTGILIKATENQNTGYNSLITSSCMNRVRTANPVFEEAFHDVFFKTENVVAIFLGGAAHIVDMHPNSQREFSPGSIMGLKTALNEQGDTVSLFIYDEGGNHLNKNPTNSEPSISIEGYYGNNNFDLSICVKPQKKQLRKEDSSRAAMSSLPPLFMYLK
ncbi:Uncharacterised protein [Legionella wadsworthii]|uniref:Uncharacterized protein n=1 Tax=Legionella wadsworthii TaxID=28088 RepID=A0A378LRV8_9GAMM|nr:hypothetical protein [Legionella wadsworthii]STY29513.1 Uncharacterised protein [Legionella wadsworthii]